WFKAGKSFNDRLINAFAVQFSKSIFIVNFRRHLLTLPKLTRKVNSFFEGFIPSKLNTHDC
ncbi:hypothetical protein, partial [Brevibacillus formosus]|uniref:hypothetical protein n=1 Tax=Brevibacillus formosus TaxID=54913 RepID=UPI003F1DC3FF